jgi:hypothetical protein
LLIKNFRTEEVEFNKVKTIQLIEKNQNEVVYVDEENVNQYIELLA